MSLVSNLETFATRIATEFKSFRTFITGSGTGAFSGLTTTATDLKGAINELDAAIGAGTPSTLDDLTDVDLTGAADGNILQRAGGIWVDIDGATIFQPLDSDLTSIAGLGTDAYGRAFLTLTNQAGLVALIPVATEAAVGLVELGSLAEHATGTDATRAATIAGVRQERIALKEEILGAGVPGALDTLDELAAALNDDADFAGTVTIALSNKQPLDADLTQIAALVSAADKVPYATGAGTWALATFTAAGRALVDDADTGAQRATLSVYSQAQIGNLASDFVATFEAGLL